MNNSLQGPSAGKAGFEFNINTVLLALRCWWKIVFPLALISAVATGSVVYFLHQPEYTSDAWLIIKEKSDVILRSLQEDTRRFIQNQIEIIRSPRLLGQLSSKPAILATPELAISDDVTATLASRLMIRMRGQSDIYVVSFSSSSPEKAELVVKEVVEAYLAFNRKLESEQDNQIIRLLEDQRVSRYEEMNQLRETVRTLSVQLTGVDPFRSEGEKDPETSKTENLMAKLQADMIRYEVAQDILAAEIKAEEERQRSEVFSITPADLDRQVETQPSYLALKEKIEQLRTKESDILKMSKTLSENKLYERLHAELESKNSDLENLKTRLQNEIKTTLEKQAEGEKVARLNAKKSEFNTGATRLNILTEKFKQGIGTAKQFAGDSLELEFRRAKLEQITKVHDEISARILAITTEQRAPERVVLFKEANRPVRPNELIPFKKIAFGAGVAFFLPIALVIAWEHIFRRVSSRSQVENANQIAVVGEVTSLPVKKRHTGIANKKIDRDVLLFEESVDSLRTYLSLVETLQGLRVLAVTSAVSGEGKTSLAAQLAVSVARATNELTLLIDGDMRSPDMHDIFGIELGPGLVEVLKGKCKFEEAIDTSFSESLHVLTAGRLTSSPHRLLSNGEFSLLLEKLGRIYRHIVIDTPPILPASESLVMARAADTAVFCMRRDYSRIDQTQEAYARMLAAGVKTAGAVLNGIPVHQYANKYGSYGYNEEPYADE